MNTMWCLIIDNSLIMHNICYAFESISVVWLGFFFQEIFHSLFLLFVCVYISRLNTFVAMKRLSQTGQKIAYKNEWNECRRS